MGGIFDVVTYHCLLEYGNMIEKSWNKLPIGEVNIDVTRFIIAVRSLQRHNFEYSKKIIMLLKRNEATHKLYLGHLERLVNIRYCC